LEDAGLRGADLRGADLRAGLKPQVLGGIEAREREREDLLSRMIPAMENLEYDAGVPKTVDG
jgi:hypothetical protein